MSTPLNPPRAALVTGAARRIGRAIAQSLADRGWAVAIHYNTGGAEAEDLARAIRDAGGKAAALGADLTREAEARTLIPAAIEALGPLTLLVNNASPFTEDGIEDGRRDLWDLHMEVNLRAPLVLTEEFARQLPEGAGGNVINLIDQRVWNLTPHYFSYTISKSALWTATRTLAMALAPRIRVNAVGPGPTLRSDRQTDDEFQRQWEGVPLRRRTDPSEIAAAIQFILDAPAMTGQMIALDGGEHLGWAQRPSQVLPLE